jgi:2-methylcitrate dehydratase PrpD
MDPTTEYLSDHVCRLTYEDLSPEAVHQVKRTLIDSLGCGVGAFDSEPASIARRIASRVQGNPPARILGTSQETSTVWRPSRIRSLSATSTVTTTTRHGGRATRAT